MFIKFKSRPSLKWNCDCPCSCWSRERKTESIEVSQIEDITLVLGDSESCDYDICRQCCWSPTAKVTILANNETNHETTFVVRYNDGKIVERLVRDAMEAAASGQSDMS